MINIKKIIKFIEKEIFNQSNGPWVIMLFLIFGVPIILLIASIPALLFVLVLYFGSNFIYDFFPKKLTSEDFLSLEIGFISILISVYLIFALYSLVHFLWKKKYKKESFFDFFKDLIKSFYYFGYLFFSINIFFLLCYLALHFILGVFSYGY